jgi:hypothetical protein
MRGNRTYVAPLALLVWLLVVAAKGCTDPNAIGVQTYGTVTGVVVDSRTQKPIPGALVSIGSLQVFHTDSNGGFVLTRVPQGTQTLHVDATALGYKPYNVDLDVSGANVQVPTVKLDSTS